MTGLTPDEVAAKEAAGLAELRRHLGADKVRFETTFAFSVKGSKTGVAISSQSYSDGRKWARFDTLMFPGDDETLADLLHTLASMRLQIMEGRR